MLFTSTSFAVFLLVVFFLYWFAAGRNLRIQNMLLLVSSYYFYGSWDLRFLFLLIFSTSLDFFTGIKIHQAETERSKKSWLWISVVTNLGFLGLFKYYNFFANTFASWMAPFGLQLNPFVLNVVLPVGISFYTFHGLSYVFDIYRGRIQPTYHVVDYSVFVSFFPLLVAGPIERATHLLPQIQTKRTFSYERAVDGLRQMLWGLFKKLVVADGCAVYADSIFGNYMVHSGSTLLLGAFFFAIQIYCDFSGYSDIALGVARLFGIELLRNFSFPYFSRDIAEFWRRWHISLTSWFKDYLYIPLGGSRAGTAIQIRNTFLIFLVSGLWHGANWTFVVWGLLHALYFLPYLLLKENRSHLGLVADGRLLPSGRELVQMVGTFSLTLVAWVFFRSATVMDAVGYLMRMFSDVISFPDLPKRSLITISFVGLFMLIEWLARRERHALASVGQRWPRWIRWSFYSSLIFSMGMFMEAKQTPFIYFQF